MAHDSSFFLARQIRLRLISFCVALLSVPGMAVGQAEPVGQEPTRAQLYASLRQEVREFQRHGNIVKTVVKLVGPTVVHIETEKVEAARRTGVHHMVEEAGSGVIVEFKNAHYILTNWHVIKDAELSNIKIELADARQLQPSRVWGDPLTDIAVMAVNAPKLISAPIGNSDDVEIGDFVLAVGSPFGLSRSVTYGIVSAKGRRDLELGSEEVKFQDFIQTDAAINPGNSGGPLINLSGEVIGINTAIASNSGGNEGIGFSIPINMVMAIARQLIEHNRVARAFLGVRLDQNFGPAEATNIGLTHRHGALINQITPNSPAQRANLQVGDVVLSFDGVPVEDDAHLINIVSLTEINREVPILVQRGRQQLSLRVRVGDRDQFEQRAQVVPRVVPGSSSIAPSGR